MKAIVILLIMVISMPVGSVKMSKNIDKQDRDQIIFVKTDNLVAEQLLG